ERRLYRERLRHPLAAANHHEYRSVSAANSQQPGWRTVASFRLRGTDPIAERSDLYGAHAGAGSQRLAGAADEPTAGALCQSIAAIPVSPVVRYRSVHASRRHHGRRAAGTLSDELSLAAEPAPGRGRYKAG